MCNVENLKVEMLKIDIKFLKTLMPNKKVKSSLQQNMFTESGIYKNV